MDTSKTLYKVNNKGTIQTWKGWVEDSFVVVEYGALDGKLRQDTYEALSKNIGKANMTTPQEQAIVEVAAKYIDKVDNKHYRYTIEEAKAFKEDCKTPMRLVNYKDFSHKVVFPCYAQYKFNGSRVEVMDRVVHNKKGVVETCKVKHLQESINSLGLDFDSEVYAHGLALQDIRSAWTKPNENSHKLKFVIFDKPKAGLTFKERIEDLYDLVDCITILGLDNIQVCLPKLIWDQEELDDYYEQALAEDYEGIVIRNQDGMYEFGTTSHDVFKRKPRYDTEAKVLKVTIDKLGHGVLHTVLSDAFNNVKVKGKMKGSHEERLYENQLQYVGQWITLEYEELSNKGIPTKPSFQEPRKCDDTGEPLE